MRRLLTVIYWIAAICFIWLPGCGSVVMACRPWIFSEQHFGSLGYYRVRICRDGKYAEGFDPENLCLTVLFSVVVSAVCLWGYRRAGNRPQSDR